MPREYIDPEDWGHTYDEPEQEYEPDPDALYEQWADK